MPYFDFTFIAYEYSVFLLLFIRSSCFLVTAPFFSSRSIQVSVRIFFSLLLSATLLPLLPTNNFVFPESPIGFVYVIVSEIVLGLVLGYAGSVIFSAFQIAGQVIDMQLGFAMLNVLDPQSGAQVPLMGNYLHLLAMIIFLENNGHHYLLRALHNSWLHIPPGPLLLNFKQEVFWTIARAVAVMFTAGIQIATPVMAALFLADLVLGMLARTVPQLNVFVVGLPLKSLLGLATLGISIPVFGLVLKTILTEVQRTLEYVLSTMPP